MSEQHRHPETGRFIEQPTHAADSPANTGAEPGTAWPGMPMDERMVQIDLPYAPLVVAAVVLPGAVSNPHGEAEWSRPSGPVTVSRLGVVEHPGQPDPFPRSLPQAQPMPHTAPINAQETGR